MYQLLLFSCHLVMKFRFTLFPLPPREKLGLLVRTRGSALLGWPRLQQALRISELRERQGPL